MKILVRILSICMLVTLIAGCAAPAATPTPRPAPTAAPQQPTQPPTPTPEPTLTPNEQWLKAAELGKFAPAKQDWAAIEAAAKKEGKVIVYANSGGSRAGSGMRRPCGGLPSAVT
ncbi:MAG: hypothetical protein H5T65_07075, partial [Chloroflexi bacterium]|nr:hypothetical protein [Chloroflexota bacterium]